ncbi:MAG: hypothetical protein ACON4W_03595 [Parvibaculales bacterium]
MPSKHSRAELARATHSLEKLYKLQGSLTDDLVKLEASLPDDADDMTEAVERYSKVLSVLIRSMNLLIQREETLKTKSGQKKKTKKEIIIELDAALDRLLAGSQKKSVSGKSG